MYEPIVISELIRINKFELEFQFFESLRMSMII